MEYPEHKDDWHLSFAFQLQHKLVEGKIGLYRTQCLECKGVSKEFGPEGLPQDIEIPNLIQFSIQQQTPPPQPQC